MPIVMENVFWHIYTNNSTYLNYICLRHWGRGILMNFFIIVWITMLHCILSIVDAACEIMNSYTLQGNQNHQITVGPVFDEIHTIYKIKILL